MMVTNLVVLVRRGELPSHHLLVLVRRNDADQGRAETEELVERRFFLLAAATHHTVRLGQHCPGSVSLLHYEAWELSRLPLRLERISAPHHRQDLRDGLLGVRCE